MCIPDVGGGQALGGVQAISNQDLARRVVQEVGAANDVRRLVEGIVNHDRELIRSDSVASPDDEVADGFTEILAVAALDSVVELDLAVVDE